MRTVHFVFLTLLVINLTLVAEGRRCKENSCCRKLGKKSTKQEKAIQALEKKLEQLTAFVKKPPASSCKELLKKDSSLKSGVYKISFGSLEVPVFCQMSDFGCGAGGWTPVMKINGTKKTFHYDSNYWSNKEIFGVNGGQTGFDMEETKLPSYWSTPFSKICLGMKMGDKINFVVINKMASSLYSLVADGQYRATSLGRNTWKSLIGSAASLQSNCNKEGFNTVGRLNHSKARIGIIGNQENDCSTSDSRIGFGTGGLHDDSNTCGNQATHNPDNGNKHIKTMGYILVQ